MISIKNELIKNLDELNCPMTCELRNADCISVYSFIEASYIPNNSYDIVLPITSIKTG